MSISVALCSLRVEAVSAFDRVDSARRGLFKSVLVATHICFNEASNEASAFLALRAISAYEIRLFRFEDLCKIGSPLGDSRAGLPEIEMSVSVALPLPLSLPFIDPEVELEAIRLSCRLSECVSFWFEGSQSIASGLGLPGCGTAF